MKRIAALGMILIIMAYLVPVLCKETQKNEEKSFLSALIQNVEKQTESGNSVEQNAKNEGKTDSDVESMQDEPSNQSQTEDAPATITVQTDGTVRTMDLETYVAGVVAAEMPADYPEDALCAQAVAARTYAMYKRAQGTDSDHPDAVVCDDYRHCAAFADLEQDASELWGLKADTYRERIEQAVQQTEGRIVTYDGEPIAAVFHAASGGQTESAKAVWGTDISYLVSVDSAGEEEYRKKTTLTANEFRSVMLEHYPKINLTGKPETWVTDIEREKSGRVSQCTIGGVTVQATDLRTQLGLSSTNFEVGTTEDTITFSCTGYGHGVGMSQYGAKAMAEDGQSWEDILLHYYSGTKIERISN